MAKQDYYEILGVNKSSTPEEIKAAYRKQALAWHPDKHQEDKKVAEEKFKEINEAYQILSDAQKKAAYDQYGQAAFEQGGFGQGQAYRQGPFSYTYYTNGANDGDYEGFSDPFDIFEQFFGSASPFGGRSRTRRKTYSLSIDFMEGVKGTEKEVVIDNKKTTIKIPAGVNEGSRVRFGDFDIVLDVSPSRKYKREGDDLISEEHVTFSQAAIGTTLEVETIDGSEKIKIHPGTQPNTLIRLRGKGVPHVRGDGRGDLYVKVVIKIPEKLSSRQKDLLREFDRESSSKKGWF